MWVRGVLSLLASIQTDNSNFFSTIFFVVLISTVYLDLGGYYIFVFIINSYTISKIDTWSMQFIHS